MSTNDIYRDEFLDSDDEIGQDLFVKNLENKFDFSEKFQSRRFTEFGCDSATTGLVRFFSLVNSIKNANKQQ